MIKKNRLIKLTQDLIRIDSQNPPGDESRIAAFVRDYFHSLKLKARVIEFKKNRSNVIAFLKGRDASRTLLLTPHLDTVCAGSKWSINPFSGQIRQGKIYGLGATDCKCNLAVSLETIKSIVEEKTILGYNLCFAATADEESGSTWGLVPLLNKKVLKPDAAIVLDADEFEIIVAQKGLLHFKIVLMGKRAHGAYPWQGVNAIGIALSVLKDLQSLKFKYPKNKYLHPPTLNIGTIRGGDKVNIVADWAEVELDFRYLPGMSARDFIAQARKIIQRHTKKFRIEIDGLQYPYRIEQSHPLIKGLKSAAARFKIIPKISGSEGATTISFFQEKNIPAVATGFGCSGCAHSVDEYVRINNLYKGAKFLEEFLKIYKFN